MSTRQLIPIAKFNSPLKVAAPSRKPVAVPASFEARSRSQNVAASEKNRLIQQLLTNKGLNSWFEKNDADEYCEYANEKKTVQAM